MGFLLKRTVDLSSFGWDDCFIELKGAAWNESSEWRKKFTDPDPKDTKLQDEIFEIVADHFISGIGLDDNNKKIDITKDNLGELPVEVFSKCIDTLVGAKPDPN